MNETTSFFDPTMSIKSFSLHREIIAGVTTFFTMAYIIVVNPLILAPTGMDPGALFVATCLSAALGCFLMGTLANYPIALAPTMSMNAYFAFVVVSNPTFTWQFALGAVFIAGVLFALLTFTGVRQWLIYQMPYSLKMAISIGIGLFLAAIAFKNLGIISLEHAHVFPVFHFAAFFSWPSLLCFAGVLLISLFGKFRVTGAILIGMLIITFGGIMLGLNHLNGIISLPPSLAPTLFHLKIPSLIDPNILAIVLTFLFVSILDNTGTTIAVLHQGALLESKSYKERLGKALFADSLASIGGSLLGTSPTGSYIESSAGVRAGGKTGLMTLTVSLLFLGALFFSPLVKAIPAYAAAAALLYVAGMMLSGLAILPWNDWTETVPALVTLVTIPITFSIADGISAAFVSYALIKCVSLRAKELSLGLWLLAFLCGLYWLVKLF